MSFWQQYQGFFVVALILVVVIGGAYLKRRAKRAALNQSLKSSAKSVLTSGAPGTAPTEAVAASLRTVVNFNVPAERIAPALKAPLLFKQTAPATWVIVTGTPQGELPVTSVSVVDTTNGWSQLRPDFVVEQFGMVAFEGDWRKFRAKALKAAQSAGISASETQDPSFARVVVNESALDASGTPQPLYRWQR